MSHPQPKHLVFAMECVIWRMSDFHGSGFYLPGRSNWLTLSLSSYPQITPSSYKNSSIGQKRTVGDSFCQTDERLFFEILTQTVEIIGHDYLLSQK